MSSPPTDPSSLRRPWPTVLLALAVFAAGAGLGRGLRHAVSDDRGPAPPAIRTDAPSATAPRPATAARPPLTAFSPVPPATPSSVPVTGAPAVAARRAELAPKARAGDAAAARRLADALDTCPRLGAGRKAWVPADATSPAMATAMKAAAAHEQREADAEGRRCAGLTTAEVREAGEWLQRAAQGGDVDAMLCYAGGALLRPDLLAPAGLSAAQRWRDEAPLWAERALEAGRAEAAALLAAMYDDAFARPTFEPYRGLAGHRPERAYFYAQIYAAHAPAYARHAATQALARYAAALDPDMRAALDAQASALAARIVFAPSPPAFGADACARANFLLGMQP